MEFLGDVEVGGLVRLGAAEDESSAESKTLGSKTSVGDPGEAVVFFGGEVNASRFAGHEGTSVLWGESGQGESR